MSKLLTVHDVAERWACSSRTRPEKDRDRRAAGVTPWPEARPHPTRSRRGDGGFHKKVDQDPMTPRNKDITQEPDWREEANDCWLRLGYPGSPTAIFLDGYMNGRVAEMTARDRTAQVEIEALKDELFNRDEDESSPWSSYHINDLDDKERAEVRAARLKAEANGWRPESSRP